MRILLVSVCLTGLVLSPAYSEEIRIAPEAVYSVATGDINRDGASDAVLLVEPDDQAYEDIGIYFYLREGDYLPLKLHTVALNMVWGNRAMMGQVPTVSIDERGSVIVTSENIAIGRHKWEQKLTIALRDGQFVVAGYTYSFYDTLDPEANGGCDVNLLTGKGVREDNGRESDMALKPQHIPAAEWGHGGTRDICGFFEGAN